MFIRLINLSFSLGLCVSAILRPWGVQKQGVGGGGGLRGHCVDKRKFSALPGVIFLPACP